MNCTCLELNFAYSEIRPCCQLVKNLYYKSIDKESFHLQHSSFVKPCLLWPDKSFYVRRRQIYPTSEQIQLDFKIVKMLLRWRSWTVTSNIYSSGKKKKNQPYTRVLVNARQQGAIGLSPHTSQCILHSIHLTACKNCKGPQRRHLPLGICGTNKENIVLAAI